MLRYVNEFFSDDQILIGLLIFLQFVLAAGLVLSADWWPIPWIALLASSPGVIMAISAWVTMGLWRIRIHPSTTDRTRLLTGGPYGYVRHPMYTGLLWFTAALLFSPLAWWRVAAWLMLLGVLSLKTVYEERSMLARFPEYAQYRQQVRRFW
jgi:protein-S-isoprenylcysteine O-methyltransferase Ste14